MGLGKQNDPRYRQLSVLIQSVEKAPVSKIITVIKELEPAIRQLFGPASPQFNKYKKLRKAIIAGKIVNPARTRTIILDEHARPTIINFLEDCRRQISYTPKVFIIHGHDRGILNSVRQVIKALNLEPITLERKPNQGNTIIEKLVHHSQVDFVISILTPDDIGKSKKSDQFKARARQNVILETGYFMGKVSRRRIFLLGKAIAKIELPSDMKGLTYCEVDLRGAWKQQLKNELRMQNLI